MVRLKLNDVFNTARDKNTTIQDNFTFDFYQKRITRNISLILQYNIDNKHKMKSETVQSENESRNRL
jgi:type IV secretory pathway VirB6-like protein